MKIREMSDMHLEFHANYEIPSLPDDKESILILAGDICVAKKIQIFISFFEKISKQFKHVIYVLGNHEYYRSSVKTAQNEIKDALTHLNNIHIFENGSIELDNVVFIAATLWTDFNKQNPYALWCANAGMNDFKLIRTGPPSNPYQKKFLAEDAYRTHHAHLNYLNNELAKNEGKMCVVITHHAPSSLSVHQIYKQDKLTPAYYSDLSEFIFNHKPKLWFHGHMHNNSEYYIGQTKIICNPKGYALRINEDGTEHYQNRDFDPNLVIEI